MICRASALPSRMNTSTMRSGNHRASARAQSPPPLPQSPRRRPGHKRNHHSICRPPFREHHRHHETSSARLPRASSVASFSNSVVRVVAGVRACAPEAESLRPLVAQARSNRFAYLPLRPRRSTGRRHRPRPAHVDVQSVLDSDDVAQQPPVLVDTVGGRFHGAAALGCRRGEAASSGGRRASVALGPEVDLGRVDLDEANSLPVSKRRPCRRRRPGDPVDGRCAASRAAGSVERRDDHEREYDDRARLSRTGSELLAGDPVLVAVESPVVATSRCR